MRGFIKLTRYHSEPFPVAPMWIDARAVESISPVHANEEYDVELYAEVRTNSGGVYRVLQNVDEIMGRMRKAGVETDYDE